MEKLVAALRTIDAAVVAVLKWLTWSSFSSSP